MVNSALYVGFSLLLLLGACTSTASAEGNAEASLADVVDVGPLQPLVDLEAGWLCEVQRFAYDDLSELDSALGRKLVGADLTRADYDEFKLLLAQDVELRRAVRSAYGQFCG